ncbi:Metal-dependent hydrolase YbeY, involved in rRNA and/or ribosome maturation and assembly [uncultured Gammaproteobacteria bacterium]|uniref:rRNA maturation RNase YbeY n=1 Tax=Bathymodiolus heckerae thiotrophic gill symbiont TaxID=1052212 RepID=UPI0010B5E234|nr:rRNA maturation RNase YbeY [Bathymodiolus heckerae thiotrophic gill symbiont]CAC9590995.1 Metal-dependent hydrolase YbeY, involved in rRNA and/or ribosome maturation and assembly [uncultured Gammaproteobacteria bacterium]CAC9964403.1 Metal-dependent hydrolase YbeY, involved in rRNA and/or ribosome maturation and assembly [uncultured Gammaproteobacteria bacterium]SHN91574.1 Metal-dependent hydrolase YbeY, involved in rRNAand/or ribosome maturation and assembly [Bathymodiolus heckerae thiotroph
MIVIQNSINFEFSDEANFCNVLQAVLFDLNKADSELLIRFVDKAEIQQLNRDYRHQDKTTNVLSFPSDLPIEIDELILGDVVICIDVVIDEAAQQKKQFNDHLMHMAIHGTLHLLGFDHIEDADAEKMEALEVKILEKINIKNPYL